jgi:hypothetical protein
MERPTSTGDEVQPTLPPEDMELTSDIHNISLTISTRSHPTVL